MAEFSKQYCSKHDMGFDGDFDIIEEWSKLDIGYIIPYICEGYGFTAIGKLEDDLTQPWVYMPDPFDYNEDGHWFTLEEIME
jgi:hypothetical protein